MKITIWRIPDRNMTAYHCSECSESGEIIDSKIDNVHREIPAFFHECDSEESTQGVSSRLEGIERRLSDLESSADVC